MAAIKTFKVLGETVEILVNRQVSGGGAAVMTQLSPPGGGPPPHVHTREDETFTVLEGEFELFDGTAWRSLRRGEVFFAQRGKPHAFRNSGSTDGKMLIFISPAGFEEYLEEISPLAMPQDMEKLQQISERFGIRFV
ncbi:MAG TPA: cupin domain-containing protein [Acidobacteriaceae bacterium]|jgi:quercetin dioxygenase-like cupin family protein|nr:cupin domain-containing protein [Acidobacteriaceae bacterium]